MGTSMKFVYGNISILKAKQSLKCKAFSSPVVRIFKKANNRLWPINKQKKVVIQ